MIALSEEELDQGIPYDDYDVLANICRAVKLLREIRLDQARATEQAMVENALESLEHSLEHWNYPCDKSEKEKTTEALRQAGDGQGVPWKEIRDKYLPAEQNAEKSYTDLCNEALHDLDKLRAAVKSGDWNRATTFVGFTESKIEELEDLTQQGDTTD